MVGGIRNFSLVGFGFFRRSSVTTSYQALVCLCAQAMTKLFSMVCLKKDQRIRSKKRREERGERIKLCKMVRQNYEETTGSACLEKVPMRNYITNVI